MTIPCLDRQNAFILEDNEEFSLQAVPSTYPTCGICNETIGDTPLFRPCSCVIGQRTYLAHRDCFAFWSHNNGFPRYCIICQSRYNDTPPKGKAYKLLLIVSIGIACIIVVIVLVHMYMCTEWEGFTSEQVEKDYGADTFQLVPEILVLPRFEPVCFQHRTSTIPSFFISISFCTSITLICFTFSYVLVNTLITV